MRFLGEGGAELKGVTSFFQRRADTLEDTMVAIFSDFSVKLLWLQRKGNKLNTKIFERYYSQIIIIPSHLEKLQIIQNINKQCSKLSSHFLIEF